MCVCLCQILIYISQLLINIRRPRASATLFRSGKMMVMGAMSEKLNMMGTPASIFFSPPTF